jgi:hypothetical protein
MRFLLASLVLAAGLAAPLRSALAQERVPAPELGAPEVHVDADSAEVILFRSASAEEWRSLGPAYRNLGVPVCRAPCDQVVDGRAGQLFFFAGKGIRTSEPFSLQGREGRVRFDVQTGPSSLRGAGVGLTALGAVAAGVGIVLATFGVTYAANDPSISPPPNWTLISGGIAGGSGLAMLTAGLVMIGSSSPRAVVTDARAAPLRIEPGARGLLIRF